MAALAIRIGRSLLKVVVVGNTKKMLDWDHHSNIKNLKSRGRGELWTNQHFIIEWQENYYQDFYILYSSMVKIEIHWRRMTRRIRVYHFKFCVKQFWTTFLKYFCLFGSCFALCSNHHLDLATWDWTEDCEKRKLFATAGVE